MTDSQLLQEFEALAYRLNIPVSREDLMGGTGGLCVVRGEQRIILDYRLDVPTQVELLARAFSQLPLDDVFLKPSLRERIDLYGRSTGLAIYPTNDEIKYSARPWGETAVVRLAGIKKVSPVCAAKVSFNLASPLMRVSAAKVG